MRLASLTIRTIWASIVSAPTRSARMTRPPVPLTVPPISWSPAPFSTGIGSPVIIDSSTALAPSITTPSTGIFSPGRIRSRSPGTTWSSATSSSRPSVCDPARRLGGKAEQGADGAAGLPACSQLEHLAQQDERDDHRGRLEVDRDLAVMTRNESGKMPGASRRDGAEDKSRPGPQRDQREHIQASADDRCPAALEERQAAPEDHRRRQHKLNPDQRLGPDRMLAGISPGTISAIESKKSGTVRTRQIQNRRLMSSSSGSSSSSAATVIGSSAIPQIGQEPGRSRTISGCIGQV